MCVNKNENGKNRSLLQGRASSMSIYLCSDTGLCLLSDICLLLQKSVPITYMGVADKLYPFS
jgi:hypothetical protein